MTVVELLALAGGSTTLAADEAVVVRAGSLVTGRAAQQDGDGAERRRVSLDALGRGDLAENVLLGHGDTVFVPPADQVYVFGEVQSPGRYAIRSDMTVQQVLSLAGGSNDPWALNRIGIVRTVGGEQVEVDAQLSDRVRPDDTVFVPPADQVYVFGEVRSPGRYAIRSDMTVQQVLSLAGGSNDPSALNRIGIVRTVGGEQVEVDAQLSDRVQSDDRVAVRAEVAYVFGEVRSPGRYAIRKDTTVVQVLSLAGGGTIFAALDGIRIIRMVGGEQVEVDVQMSDRVQPDDVVRVPNRFF